MPLLRRYYAVNMPLICRYYAVTVHVISKSVLTDVEAVDGTSSYFKVRCIPLPTIT